MTRTAADEAVGELAGCPRLPDRFRPVRRLGGGGQGEVWLVEDRLLSQRVAVKLIQRTDDGAVRARITQEARVGRQLSHPNLVRVFDLVDAGEMLVVVMEWVAGGSLKSRLKTGPMAVDEVVAVAAQVLGALACLHAEGIVHRDVKPSNLLLDGEGRVKLGDLGLVREVGAGSDLTRTGASVGTPSYMSPEQLRGGPVGPPTDLYALGVTLYELLTGRRPFVGRSEWETANAHLATAAGSPRRARPECPRWLASFVLRLLEKEPGNRWPDAAVAGASLARRFAPRWRLWRRAAAAVLVGSGLAVAVWAGRSMLGRAELSSATVRDGDVVAEGPGGRELWRRTFGPAPVFLEVGDFVGTAAPEVAVGLVAGPVASEGVHSEIVVLDAGGAEVVRFGVPWPGGEDEIYPHFSPEGLLGGLAAHDLDGDGRDELIWSSSHPLWYPESIGVWWGHGDGSVRPLLVNSGRIHDYAFADADGDGALELVFTGVNNPIGYQSVVAVADVDGRAYSPDLFAQDNFSSLLTYVPLGPEDGLVRIDVAPPSGIRLRSSAGLRRLIGGVPEPGGAGLGAVDWRRFWADLETLCRNAAVEPASGLAGRRRFAVAHGPVLSTPAARLAFHLLLARSLAQVGATGEAVAVLREQVEADPAMRDGWLRLGEQLLIAGRREEGRRALVRSLLGPHVGRSSFDASLLLELDGALHGGVAAAESVRGAFSATGFRVRIVERLAPAAAFFRGDWSSPAFTADLDSSIFKGIDVMRLWARLERGEAAADVTAAAVPLERNPETAEPARLLRALLRLRAGDVAGAEEAARTALAELDRRGRESFEAFVWVPVAEWLCGNVLEAAGEPVEARTHLERAAALAAGSWFARPGTGPVTEAARSSSRP